MILVGIPAVALPETGEPSAVDAPANIDAHPSVRKYLAELMRKSPTIHRQCIGIAKASHVAVTIRLTGRPAGYSRARTTMVRGKGGAIHAEVEIPVGTDLVELLAHELEHVSEQIEGVDLPSLIEEGSRAIYRVDGAFETIRARDAGAAAAREVQAARPY